MWEDTLIRLACATRWLEPTSYKLLHDHHGAVLARPALGHLASAYVAIAESTRAWKGWHEFREPDPRLVAFFTRSLCGSWPARRALLASIGEWIAADRPSFLAQLDGIANLDEGLLELLGLMCRQLADDLLLDLPRGVNPEDYSRELKSAFPPSLRTVGLGVLAGAIFLRNPRAIVPGVLGGGLLAGGAETLAAFMLTSRRRERVLDLCLETGVSPHALGLWASKQTLLSRARSWGELLRQDRVLAVAFAFEQLTRVLDHASGERH
jgi:hypothetical protein